MFFKTIHENLIVLKLKNTFSKWKKKFTNILLKFYSEFIFYKLILDAQVRVCYARKLILKYEQ